MTVDLRSIPTQIIIQQPTPLDVSQAFISLSISGNALDDSGWYRPRGQIVLGQLSGLAESFDCRVNPGRWAPGNVVSVSVWFGAWVPLPWRLRILSYPNRPSPAEPTITLEVGTDADLLNYRAPEGDPGIDEYGVSTGATFLINRALTQAGAPHLTDSITTLNLPFSPSKTTSGSWISYAGSVAYAARSLLWQQTNGAIRATPLTLDGLTATAAYTVGTDEAEYVFDAVGEQPPEIVEVQGTTYRIESAEPEDTDVTEVINGVETRTRVEYKDWDTDSPKVIETVWIPLGVMRPDLFPGSFMLSIYFQTTTTKTYDAWDRLVEEFVEIKQPSFIVPYAGSSSVLIPVSETQVTYEFPLIFSTSTEELQRLQTAQVMTSKTTIDRALYKINNNPLTLEDRLVTVETWEKKGAELYLYRKNTRDDSPDPAALPPANAKPEFVPPPQTTFKPAALQRTEIEYRGQARFTNAVGSSYAEKKSIITLPSGMGVSSDQCRAHAGLWGRVRQGRQFPIRWAADISATWLQNWSPIRRVDFTLGGITTAYLIEAFNIQIDQRSAAVGGLGFELGRTTAGSVTNPPYVQLPNVLAHGAVQISGGAVVLTPPAITIGGVVQIKGKATMSP